MALFAPAYQLVAIAEGGYQAHPEDRGNYNSRGQLVGTNWGISALLYEDYLGRPPSKRDMQAMTRNTARKIYQKRFWDRIKGPEIRTQQVANVLLDGYVNHGRFGVQMIQEILGTAQDGVVGPITLRAINAAEPAQLVQRYVQRREAAYRRLANTRAGQAKFLQGWLNRLKKFVSDRPATAAAGGAGALLLAAAAGWWLTRD